MELKSQFPGQHDPEVRHAPFDPEAWSILTREVFIRVYLQPLIPLSWKPRNTVLSEVYVCPFIQILVSIAAIGICNDDFGVFVACYFFDFDNIPEPLSLEGCVLEVNLHIETNQGALQYPPLPVLRLGFPLTSFFFNLLMRPIKM